MSSDKKITNNEILMWIEKERQQGREPSFEEFKERYDEYLFHKSLSVLARPMCFMGSVSSSLVLIYTSVFLVINIILKSPVNFSVLILWALSLVMDLICCTYIVKNKNVKKEDYNNTLCIGISKFKD